MKTIYAKTGGVLLLAGFALLTSCQENSTNNNTEEGSVAIAIGDVPPSPEFADATLILQNVKAVPAGDSVKVQFAFDVKNYELKAQTADAAGKGCNNSAQGQHIHFILNNSPYTALYEPRHEITLPRNTTHYLMAFLSRSYHESLKNPGAALLYHFQIDENGAVKQLDDPGTPMIFYSRPKGDYLGADTENLLLDYYIWNADAGEDFRVKAAISADGIDTTLVFNDWQSRFLQQMPMGKASIKLTLIDRNGNKMSGPETEVTREIGLAQQEPLP